MINWFQTIILSVTQGITEFLPISSSAHLILMPRIFNWPDQGIDIDVAVHFGSLGAVLAYFCRDTWRMMHGSFKLLSGKITLGGELFLQLSLATVPVVIVGFILKETGTIELFRQAALIGWMSIIFGIFLWVADRFSKKSYASSHMTYLKALTVGLVQVIALIPGVSRSGICMTAMRALGFNRVASAKFACLMSIPTIIAAATLSCIDIYQRGSTAQLQTALGAVGISFAVSLISIAFMMRLLERSNFNIFILYRVLLGCGLLYWVYV